MKAKRYLFLLLGVVLLGLSATAFAEGEFMQKLAGASEVEVEDGENLPSPMVVTYDATTTVVVTIPAHSPVPVETPDAPAVPIITPVPTITPQPTTKSTDPPQDIKDDYKKGSVYGHYLSTRELKEVKRKWAKSYPPAFRMA